MIGDVECVGWCLVGGEGIAGLDLFDGLFFDGAAGDGGGVGGDAGDGCFCGGGEDDGAAEAAAEQAGEFACLGVALHCLYGVVKITAAGFQQVVGFELALAVSASAVVEAEVGDAELVEGLGQGDLFGGVAVGQEAVAADDEWGLRCVGEMQGADELDAVGGEADVLLGWHGDTLLIFWLYD